MNNIWVEVRKKVILISFPTEEDATEFEESLRVVQKVAEATETTFDKVWRTTIGYAAEHANELMDEAPLRQRLLKQKTPSGVS